MNVFSAFIFWNIYNSIFIKKAPILCSDKWIVLHDKFAFPRSNFSKAVFGHK